MCSVCATGVHLNLSTGKRPELILVQVGRSELKAAPSSDTWGGVKGHCCQPHHARFSSLLEYGHAIGSRSGQQPIAASKSGSDTSLSGRATGSWEKNKRRLR